MIGRITRWILRIIKAAVLLVLTYVLFNYLTCPVYDFPEPKPFEGNTYFNPYEGLDSAHWRKSNFQIQSYAWWGITGGRHNTNQAIDSIYSMLLYDIITTSDYMKINRHGSDRPEYVPVYEHGYGVRKQHQVVVGAGSVSWRDYPIFQNKHHKQHIIDLLKRKNELVYIAHPKLRDGYTPEDFRQLTGYDGIEVLNYMRFSIEHWDAALSAGRYVTIMGNDDAHDIRRTIEVGHRCTYVYVEDLTTDSIIEALRKGRSYGADLFREPDETYEEKAGRAEKVASFQFLTMRGDTVIAGVTSPALEWRFIGQEGRTLQRNSGGETAKYVFGPEDTYVRVEVTFPDRNVFFFNPVVRDDGDGKPGINETARVNKGKTALFFGVSWTVVALLIVLYFRNRIRYRRSR